MLLLGAKLPFPVVQQLQSYCAREGKTLDNVTFSRIKEMLQKYCGAAVPHVNIILNCFGPDRKVKPADKTMIQHVLSFRQNIHSCMNPADGDVEGLRKLKDLLQRTYFFASLDDPEVEKALTDIPEDKATFEEFTKVAIERAEQLAGYKSSRSSISKIQVAEEGEPSVLRAGRDNYRTYRSRSNHSGRGRGHGRYPDNHHRSSRNTHNREDQQNHKKEVLCFTCGGKGHLQFVCPSYKGPISDSTKPQHVKTSMVGLVETDDDDYSPGIYSVTVLRRPRHIDISVVLNGDVQALLEFDTAAGECIMPKAWLSLFREDKRPKLRHTNVKLNLANGQSADVCGEVILDVVPSFVKHRKPVNTLFYVVNGPHALMGRPLIAALFPGLLENVLNLSGESLSYHGNKKYT